MSDDLEFSTPDPVTAPRSPVVLPWMVAVLAIVALGVVAVYAKKMVDDQAARAFQAMRMADEYGSRAGKLDADQKDARRQAISASEKADELRAANARLSEQVADKDAALLHQRERHQKLVSDVRAATRSSRGKTLVRRIDGILARDSAVERAEGPQASNSPDAGTRTRHR
jgi:hypothetical protein